MEQALCGMMVHLTRKINTMKLKKNTTGKRKDREDILSKHFEAEYGLQPTKKQLRGFKYVFTAMEEYAGQDFEGYIPEPFEPDDPDNPRLLNHHHIAFHGGWITWRGPKKPTKEQMDAFEELAAAARLLDPPKKEEE